MDTLKRETGIVKSGRDEMVEERLTESQIIGSKLKASNEEYESSVIYLQHNTIYSINCFQP